MAGWLDALLQRMLQVPEYLFLLVLGLAAAIENLIPPLPADAIILLGGLLVGRGASSLWAAFLVVWLSNVAGALGVYAIGRVYGPEFFSGRLGRWLLRPRQRAGLSTFYHRFGFAVIFISRFLPMFRSVVPVFAGVSGVGFFRTAVPVALASGLWYGLILYLGATAGQNWETIVTAFEQGGRWLSVVALGLAVLLVRWWWRSRREPPTTR